MNATRILTHPQYSDLVCTLGAPSEDAYASSFNILATSKSTSAGILTAGYNLIVACAQGIARAEIGRLVDDWPALPERAFIEVNWLAGGLNFEGPGVDADEVNAWKFDLAATVAAAKEIAELRAKQADAIASAHGAELAAIAQGPLTTDDDRLAELLAEHQVNIEALMAAGLNMEAAALLVARFNRRGQLTTIRTRDFGVLVIRRPGFQEQLTFASNTTSQGNYTACKLLSLAVVEYPVNGAIGPRLVSSPSLTTSIAQHARGMVTEGMGAQVKKG